MRWMRGSNEIEIQHKHDYIAEREDRWRMAEKGEEPAIKELARRLSNILQIDEECIKYYRFDEKWFEQYPPDENNWVRGCPDYSLEINLGNNRYSYVEIKLKAVEFKKTVKGGTTKNGSIVPKYGCTSYYLDVEPVYQNIQHFAERTKIDKVSIWLAFVRNDLSEFRLISLACIQELIKDGWNGIALCRFGEGYGQETYLIPKDATTDISELTREMVISATMETLVLPQSLP